MDYDLIKVFGTDSDTDTDFDSSFSSCKSLITSYSSFNSFSDLNLTLFLNDNKDLKQHKENCDLWICNYYKCGGGIKNGSLKKLKLYKN
jgi:hypothetical protein